MARNAQPAPLFVDGDYEAPEGSELPGGVLATGYLRVGDGTIARGDLFGAEGIELGDNVTVQGNLFSHGEISWGDGLQLSGTIYSRAPKPLEEALVRAGLAGRPDPELPLLQTAVSDTLQLLLEIAWDGHLDGLEGYPDSWWGLAWDETIEVVERFLDVADELYRGGGGVEAWTTDELLNILLPKAIGRVVPLSVDRQGNRAARIKVGRPQRRFDPMAPDQGWPWPTVSLLNLVGYAANGSFRLVVNGTEDLLEAGADPEAIDVTIEFIEEAEAA